MNHQNFTCRHKSPIKSSFLPHFIRVDTYIKHKQRTTILHSICISNNMPLLQSLSTSAYYSLTNSAKQQQQKSAETMVLPRFAFRTSSLSHLCGFSIKNPPFDCVQMYSIARWIGNCVSKAVATNETLTKFAYTMSRKVIVMKTFL